MFHETHAAKAGHKLDLIKGIHNVMQALHLANLRRYFIIVLLWTLGWGLSVQWYGVFAIEKFQLSQQGITWGLILQGLLWTFGGSFLNPILLKRYSTKTACLTGFAGAILFIVLSSFANSFILFTSMYALAAVGASFALSNALNLLSIASPKSIQGKTMGLSQSMMSLAWFLVPIAGSALGNVNVNLFYPIAAMFLFFAWILLIAKKQTVRQ